MGLRGENVGSAYVRILADGSGLDDSIRDEFRDSDDAFDAAGGRGAKRYTTAFEKEMQRKPNQTRLRNSLIDAIAKNDFLNKEFFRSNNWRNFRKGMEDRFGEAGALAAKNLEQSLIEGMTFEGLNKRLENITVEVARAVKQIQREEDASARERLRIERETLAKLDFEFEQHVVHSKRRVDQINEQFETLRHGIDRVVAGHSNATGGRRTLIHDLSDIRDRMIQAGGASKEWLQDLDDQEKRLRIMHPRITRYSNSIGRLADVTGKAFGRGSRNNFVNFIGALARGLVNTLQIIPRLTGKLIEFGQTVKYAFDESMRDSGSVFRAGMAGIAAALESGGAAIAIMAGAAIGAVVLIGPLVAIMSLLAGVVTALASSIAFALIGGLAALVGALAPVGFAIAGVAGAFLAMSDAQKKALKADVKPLVNSFKELGREAGKPIFDNLGEQARRLAPVVKSLNPLFRGIGTAISNVGDYWLKALEGPGFARFRSTLERFIPNAIESLGRSLGNTLGGLGGVFEALAAPGGLLERFLGWLEKITGNFAKWANSKKGQQELISFFDKAGDSASKLGDFLGAVTEFLGEIFDRGRGTGDDIITDMSNKIRELTKWLEDHPNALGDWFKDADKAAQDIGRVIAAISGLIDALDTPETRRLGLAMITAVSNMISVITRIIEVGTLPVRLALRGIENVFANFSVHGIANRIGTAFSSIPGFVHRGIDGIPGLVRGVFSRLPQPVQTAVQRIVGAFNGVGGRIAQLVSPVTSRLQTIWNRLPPPARDAAVRVMGAFANVPGRIAGFVASTPSRVQAILSRLPGIGRTIATQLVNAFLTTPGRIRAILDGLPGAMASIGARMVAAARGIPGQIVALFAGLPARIIAQVGTIHLPTPTINLPNIPRIHIPGTAIGGMFDRAQVRLIGEAGPEAVVPLRRPLDQVDPAVRWLSAIAQGKMPPGMATGGVSGGRSLTIAEGAIQVITPNSDAHAVAQSVLNRVVAYGY